MIQAREIFPLTPPVCPPAIRLGSQHGYSFDGDFVHLNAEILVDDTTELARHPWALQLWACEPTQAGEPQYGFKVAELPLDVSGHASPVHSFTVSGVQAAITPVGSVPLAMRLALRAKDVEGKLYDLAAYPALECFIQPRLSGETRVSVDEGRITVTVDSIENPRGADNLSGTLSLELRSQTKDAAGLNALLASTELGVLSGQCVWLAPTISVAADAWPVGATLTLVLREWGPNGYLDRDRREIQDVRPAAAPVAGTDKAARVAEPAAPIVVAAPAVSPAAPAATASTGVSVNTASQKEIQAVKGISAAIAKAIVAARPYKTMDELCRAKGMGPKLLEKVREFLVL